MLMKKAVLFDFDGTLINTNELIFSSYKVAFKTVLNREIEMEEMLNLYGRPLHASLMEYGEACERLCQVYREFNLENHDKLAKPFDGALTGVKKYVKKAT
jgi:pyrophosphatase PpaX